MEPQSAARSVVTTPELALSLFSYLGPHDLAQCIRVCKEWVDHIEPILWRNVCIVRFSYTRPPEAGLIKNSRHIRTVKLALNDFSALHILAHGVSHALGCYACTTIPGTFCTDLKRIKFGRRPIDSVELLQMSPHLASLLDHNRRLTHLTLALPDVEIDDLLPAAIRNLKNLQHLTVNNRSHVKPGTILLLLQICLPLPNLTELWMNLTVFWETFNDDDNTRVLSLETIIKEAAIARFSQTPTPGRIKSLQLPVGPEHSDNPLALPLLQSDLLDLKSCTAFSFTRDFTSTDVEQIVREYCPNIRHLWCASYHDLFDGVNTRAFIRGCSGLQSFASSYFCDSRYNDDIDAYESQWIISTLVSNHFDTLEDFELEHCTFVYSSDLQAVLSQCSHLKRFHVTVHRLDNDAGFDFEDVSKGEWVCTELKELCIAMGRHSSIHANHFYQQIGRLEKLERLVLDVALALVEAPHYAWDLTLSRGWLGELANFKNLRSLSLAVELCFEMGQAEVEFIHEHWPLLREIHIIGRDMSRVREQAHWQWLCNKRPQLRFKAQEFSWSKRDADDS